MRLEKGARALVLAATMSLTPKDYIREVKRIAKYRYYSRYVRQRAKEILERCGVKI